MRYRPLGPSGLQVSVVGLGCNNFGRRRVVNGTRAVVDAAIDAGITLFDTAGIYGGAGASETLLGEVLGARRDKIVLAAKFGHGKTDMGYGPAAGAKGGRAYIKRAVTESLRRLRTDYLDLHQIHTPDPVTPIDETITALDELVTEARSGTPATPISPDGSSRTPSTCSANWAAPGSSRRRTTGRCWSGPRRPRSCPRP